MEPPTAAELRRILKALEAEDWPHAADILEDLLAHGPSPLNPYEELEGEEASMAEKAWACATLARDRVEDKRFAVARVAIRSAIDHVEETVEETSINDPGTFDLDPETYR